MPAHPSYFQSQPYIRMITPGADGLVDTVLSPDTFPFVTGVTVTLAGTTRAVENTSTIEMSLDMPYEEGLRLLNGEYGNLIGQGNFLVVSIGYRGGDPNQATPFYTGMMDKGGEGLSLTPEGLSGSFRATSTPSFAHYKETFSGEFAEKTPTDKFKYVLEKMGFGNTVITKPAEDWLAVPAGGQTPEQQADVVGAYSYVDALRMLLARYGLLFFAGVIGGAESTEGELSATIYVEGELGTEEPGLRFGLRSPPEGNTWPILAWNPEVKTAHFILTANPSSAGVAGCFIDRNGNVVTVAANPAAGGGVSGSAQSGDATAGAEEASTGDQVADQPTDTGGSSSTPSEVAGSGQRGTAGVNVVGNSIVNATNPERASLQNSDLQRHPLARVAGTKASLTTLGCPSVFPGQMVAVGGVGDFLAGNWEVQGITHSWSSGGWETTLKLNMQVVAPTGGTNSDPPDEEQ